MAEDPGERQDAQDGEGENTFIDRHLGKIVAAALLLGLAGVAVRALVA